MEKIYSGHVFHDDGRVFKNTANGLIQVDSNRKYLGRLAAEAWMDLPKRRAHRHVWHLDGDQGNLQRDNIAWGEMPQLRETAFLREYIKHGQKLQEVCEVFGISIKFGAFIVLGREAHNEEVIKLLF